LLVAPESSAALSQALALLIGDPTRRQALGAAGQARVAEHFRLEGNLDRLAAKFGLAAADANRVPNHALGATQPE